MENYIPVLPNQVVIEKIHNAITASVVLEDAEAIPCAGAKSIALAITEAGTVNNRQGDFTVYVSVDSANYTQYKMLIDNVTNTNAQNLTRVATKNRAVAGTDVLFFDPGTLGGITRIKIVPTITDGALPTGNFTVKASISY